jgi:pyruvate/2-oxoglutarate dehydrogenase complex dihydrolipoamide acyltransferase (E2) component
MAIEIKVPALGEGVNSGDVLEVFVKVGDTLQLNDNVVELETDKATVTIPATSAGKVVEVLVKNGATVNVGQALVRIEAAAGAASSQPAPVATAPAAPAQASPVAPVTPPAQPSTPAPQPNTPAVAPPALASSAAAPSSPALATTPAITPTTANTAQLSGELGSLAAGPAIRRFAREVGVDLRQVTGTGPSGRILRDDILAVVRTGTARSAAAPATAANGATAGGSNDNWGPVRLEKLTKIRATIAQKMHESWSTVPRVTNFDDADVTELEQIRQNNKKDYEAKGIKLTTMPFIIKAVAMSLKSHPVINASIDVQANQIIYKDYVNVGIAIDSERGLVVPSLRNADKSGIPEIARDLSELAESVRTSKFSIDDLRGSTFTISNLGAIGGTYSTPIINVPETAILLVGRSRKLPVVVNDTIQVRLMMPLSLSYDHRLIDGAAAARFLNDVIGYLQAPSKLLLAL